jgi:galactokinase
MDSSPLSAHPDQPRVLRLLRDFETLFSSAPSKVTCVPGRVNLIGEHIDYCGYAVLPMAIEQERERERETS